MPYRSYRANIVRRAIGPVISAAAVGLAALWAGDSPAASPRSEEELVGRRLVVAMEGTTPSVGLLARIRRGEIAGVILFGGNIRSVSQVRALTAALRTAAAGAGRPPPLVVADQEGGRVRRLRWAPPANSAQELGRLAPARIRAIGRQTGAALRRAGITVDLAPVADVSVIRGSFVSRQRRAFGARSRRVGAAAAAFAAGLGESRVAATLKHFPGLGRAVSSTDLARVTIDAPRKQLDSDARAFVPAIAAGVQLVMVSSAAYPAYGVRGSAAWSPAVLGLVRSLGFDGVTITDALEPLARTHRRELTATALLSARAGVDLLLLTGRESATAAVYRSLVAHARAGRLRRNGLERAAARVDALAAALAG